MKTYLFDFDGTLVDSMPTYSAVMIRVLDENGIKYQNDILKYITPLGYVGTAEYYVKLGVPLPKEEIIATFHRYALKEYCETIPAKSNVIEVIKELHARGCSLNVLTASPHDMLDPCLKRLGIFHLFENVWSCEDFNTTKSDPEIYRMAAEKIGESVENILFLDDNFNADKTAKQAGMKVCGVFDESSAEYTDEIKQISDYYIDDFSQLLELE